MVSLEVRLPSHALRSLLPQDSLDYHVSCVIPCEVTNHHKS
jgi:hypothetical protein